MKHPPPEQTGTCSIARKNSGNDQEHDDPKKEYCEVSINSQEDKIEELERKTSVLEKTILKNLKALEARVSTLEASQEDYASRLVVECMQQRQDQQQHRLCLNQKLHSLFRQPK